MLGLASAGSGIGPRETLIPTAPQVRERIEGVRPLGWQERRLVQLLDGAEYCGVAHGRPVAYRYLDSLYPI